jgi:hypothetical protein
MIKNEYYDGAENKINGIEYSYNDKGIRVMEKGFEFSKKGSLMRKTIQKFDAKGNRIKKEVYNNNGERISIIVCEYDDNGNLTKKAELGNDEIVISEVRHEYDYDQYGNWVKRKSIINDTKRNNSRKPLIKYRIIEYFKN